MNLVPLNSTEPDRDGVILVNLDHVYCISRNLWFPNLQQGKEGSRLHFVIPEKWTLDVQESRVEILRLIEGSGKFSAPATNPKNHE